MSETLTKAKLVERLHGRVGVTKKEAGELVDEVFCIMRDSLQGGEKVKISGFGNFLVRDKGARRGRNRGNRARLSLRARSRRAAATVVPPAS